VGSLRKRSIMRAIHEATVIVTRHEARFRIVHLSLQRTHIHLIVHPAAVPHSDLDTPARPRLRLRAGAPAHTIHSAGACCWPSAFGTGAGDI
jgi:hypothetical protein